MESSRRRVLRAPWMMLAQGYCIGPRTSFFMYVQHGLTRGFVELLRGHAEEGRRHIEAFCANHSVSPDDHVLTACIRAAEDAAKRPGK